MTERRFENRFACADLVRVHWVEPERAASAASENGFRATEGVLEDISRIGACVQVEERIPLRSTIVFTLGDDRFTGRVCYCVYRDYGYFVGVRFDDATEWSGEAGKPAHLTDLTKIAAESEAL